MFGIQENDEKVWNIKDSKKPVIKFVGSFKRQNYTVINCKI